MHVLACALVGMCLGQSTPLESLEFRPGTLEGWEGEGFYLTNGTPRGPGRAWGVCSSDGGCPGRTATLSRSLRVPDNATHLRCRGYLHLAAGCDADHRLDVVLMDESRRAVPKQVSTSGGWVATSGLLPRWKGEPRDYAWDVLAYRGQTLRLLIRDLDDRPHCHAYAAGFHWLVSAVAGVPQSNDDFTRFMMTLEDKHHLPIMSRYETKRFVAISNAPERFSRQHMRYCEVFFDQFINHFSRKGFTLKLPAQKLALAIFCEPKGFEAYLGRRMPPGITGVYHTPSNRLVLYDLAQNAYLLAGRDEALRRTEHASPHDRLRLSDTVQRRYKDAANDMNLGTTMHECAHLMSFNCGMLYRGTDVPVWLAEGLATYCESTDEGDWQSLGSPNPMRIETLRRAEGGYMSVPELLNDSWLNSPKVLLGYAQSWALFRLLMEERPAALRNYLGLVASRRAPEYRVDDFREAIGDLGSFEQRYRTYQNNLVHKHPLRPIR
jgi:hypothetical protein